MTHTYKSQKLMILDVPNNNNHLYTTELVNKIIESSPREVMGMLGVNSCVYPNINFDKVSHKISNLRIEECYWVGDVTILKTPCGDMLTNLIERKIDFDFRPTGVATIEMDNDIVVIGSDYKLISIDAVVDGA
jgi:hypothetical protein